MDSKGALKGSLTMKCIISWITIEGGIQCVQKLEEE